MKLRKSQEADIVLKYLSSENLLKVALKDHDAKELEYIEQLLVKVVAELKDECELKRIAAEIRENERQDLIAEIEARGFSLQELIGGQKKAEKKVSRPKYAYQTGDGTIKYWSGFGRVPKDLKEQLQDGKSLDDFLIDKQS